MMRPELPDRPRDLPAAQRLVQVRVPRRMDLNGPVPRVARTCACGFVSGLSGGNAQRSFRYHMTRYRCDPAHFETTPRGSP